MAKKVLLAGAAVALVGAVALRLLGSGGAAPRTDLVTHQVGYDQGPLTVTERGTLESAVNSDVVCQVKAGTRGVSSSRPPSAGSSTTARR